MDRNQLVGLSLIVVLFAVYYLFFAPSEPLTNPNPQSVETTSEKVENPAEKDSISEEAALPDSVVVSKYAETYGELAKKAVGEEKEVILENKDIQVVFSSKGGSIKRVLLKKYLTYYKEKLFLVDENSNKMSFKLPTKTGYLDLNDFYFTSTSNNTVVSGKDSATVSFKLEAEPGKFVERIYTLQGEGFLLSSSIKTSGITDVSDKEIKFSWINDVKKVERDLDPTRNTTTINYYTTEGDFSNLKEASLEPESEKLNAAVKWVAMKQRFFVSSIIASEPFTSAELKSSVNTDDTTLVKHLEAHLSLPASALKDGQTNFKFYFGPNNYQITKKVTEGFGNNVYLGWTIFSTINKYLVVPIFNFLENYMSNYGIIILILVLIIKLILFPLSYKSHISLAKTKVLKPELDEIKAKHGDDMQKVQAEQMQLYSKVGVNPLSGCIPVLLQMPIFLALYNFFPNSIELRQESLLWAKDLSTYDSIATLPFTIPGYGDHVSLFCILMTISTLIYTWFNNQVSTVTGPMKSMQYVMPIIFLFFFNSLAAGLTYYYFINNLLTIFQQLAFRSFVDEKKIRKKLEENKAKNVNKKKSKFQQRLEDAMKQAETTKKVSETKKKK